MSFQIGGVVSPQVAEVFSRSKPFMPWRWIHALLSEFENEGTKGIGGHKCMFLTLPVD